MTTFNQFLEWGAIIIAVLSIIVTLVVAVVLIKNRDVKYKEKYDDFQRQKRRVELDLERARQSQTGVQ